MNPGNLRPLQSQAGHQPLLAEDKRVDIAPARGRRQAFPHALVHHDDAGTDPDLPPLALVEILQRFLVHEEHGVAERLHTGLEPIGCGKRTVVADRFPFLPQRAFRRGPRPSLR